MITRREALRRVTSAAPGRRLGNRISEPATSNVVREVNRKRGTTDWILTSARVDPATRYRSPWIEGYCSRTSVRAGETIEFKVSTNPPSSFVIDLYGMGYYRGMGGRRVGRFGPFRGGPQPDPSIGEQRLRECAWQTAMRLTVPRSTATIFQGAKANWVFNAPTIWWSDALS